MLMFFACGCMFVLGILVGRNNAPVNFDIESLEQKLDELPASVLAPAIGIANANLDEIPFEFYDKLREGEILEPESQVLHSTFKRTKYGKKPRAAFTAKVIEPGQAPAEILVASAESKPKPAPEAITPIQPDRDADSDRKVTPARVEIAKVETPRVEIARVEPPSIITPAPAEPPKPEIRETPVTIVAPAAPVAPVAPEPPAEKVVTTEVSRGYAIQVASLKEPDKAQTVRDKFRSKGYPAYTQQAVVEGKGQWWRVRIGPYADKAQAQSDLGQLQKAGVDAILFFAEP